MWPVSIPTKRIWMAGVALLIIFVSAGVYLASPAAIYIPAGMCFVILAFQYPQILVYLLAASIPWSMEYQAGDSLAIDIPDEILMLLAAVVAVALWIKQRKNFFRSVHPLLVIVLLQWLWIVCTVITSTDVVFSLKYLAAKSWYLLTFLLLPLLLSQQVAVIKRTAVILLVSTLLVTVVIFIRHAADGLLFATINHAVVPFFRNHVVYASLLVCMVPVLVACYQLADRKYTRLIIVLLMLFTITALYFSYSRGAWLALMAGALSYWLIRKRLLVVSVAVMFLLMTGLVFWLRHDDRYLQYAHDFHTTVYHEQFDAHLKATYQLNDVSTAERFYRWIAGVKMVEDYWLTGSGPTTFYGHYKSYSVPLFRTWVSRNEERSTVHNYFLLTLIEQGAAGLLLLIMLLVAIMHYLQKLYSHTRDRLWKAVLAAVASIMIMQLVVNSLSDLIETDKVGSVFYWCIAVIIIAARKIHEPSKK